NPDSGALASSRWGSKSVFLSALLAFSNVRVAASESNDIRMDGRRRVETPCPRDQDGGILETSLPLDTCCCRLRPPRSPSTHPTAGRRGPHAGTRHDPVAAASMQQPDGQPPRTRDEHRSLY